MNNRTDTSTLTIPPWEPGDPTPSKKHKKKKIKEGLYYTLIPLAIAGAVIGADYYMDGELNGFNQKLVTPPVVATATPTPSPEESSAPAPSKTPAVTPEAVPSTGAVIPPSTELPADQAPTTVEPVYLSISKVGLNIPIINQGLEHRGGNVWAMKLPTLPSGLPDSNVGGWLNSSAPLSSSTGVTTIASHVNHWTGPEDWAPFHKLYDTEIGDIVSVTGGDGKTYQWKIVNKAVYTQDELSSVIPVEDLEGDRKLVMVTCHVDANGKYTKNLVVTAEPIE